MSNMLRDNNKLQYIKCCNIKKEKKFLMYVLVLSLFFIFPGEWGNILIGNRNILFIPFFIFFFILNLFKIIQNKYKFKYENNLFFVILIVVGTKIFFLFYSLFIFDVGSSVIFIKLLLVLLYFLLVYNLINLDYMIKGIIIFIVINLISASIGIFIMPFTTPFQAIVDYDNRTLFNYLICFSKAGYSMGDIIIRRPSGWLDEPGQVAFLIMHAHFINQIYIKNKKLNILLIIGGILTTSLAFIMYLSLYFLISIYKIRLKYLILLIVSFVILIFSYIKYAENNKNLVTIAIDKFLVERLTMSNDSDKVFKGDNRTERIKNDLHLFYDFPLLGVGSEKYEMLGSLYGSNIMSWGAEYGIFTFVALFLPYIIIMLLLLKNKQILYFFHFLILFFFYIQRPSFTTPIYVFLLILILLIVLKKGETRHEIKYNNS